MTRAEKERRMLSDPIPHLIVRMAIPTTISMLVTTFYNMADTFFVGMLESTAATGAVGVAAPAMNIIQAVAFFFGQGSGNAISRKLGQGERDTATSLASCGFFGALLFGVVLCGVGLATLTPLCNLLGSTDTILPYAKSYLSIVLLGAPFNMCALVLNNHMRFQGSASYAMIGITSGALLNVALDPLLMFGFDMGIAGAALATVLSQTVSLCVLVGCARASRSVPIRLGALRGVPALLGEIFHGGLPSLCRQGISAISTACLNVAAKPFDDAAIAAMSVVGRIMWFASATTIGFGQGFQPVCGFNYGAGRTDRVKRAFWFSVQTSTIMLVTMGGLCAILAPQLVGIFRDDPAVIEIGSLALRLHCTTLPLFGWICLNNMLLQTCKKTAPASILAAARQGLFFFPTVLILARVWGLFGIQFSQVISDLLSFALATALYLLVDVTGRRNKSKIKRESEE